MSSRRYDLVISEGLDSTRCGLEWNVDSFEYQLLFQYGPLYIIFPSATLLLHNYPLRDSKQFLVHIWFAQEALAILIQTGIVNNATNSIKSTLKTR